MRIPAYKSTDGRLFEDKALYRQHQNRLHLLDGVRHIANRATATDAFNKVGFDGVALRPEEIADFLLEHQDDLLLAFKGKLQIPPADPAAQAALTQHARTDDDQGEGSADQPANADTAAASGVVQQDNDSCDAQAAIS